MILAHLHPTILFQRVLWFMVWSLGSILTHGAVVPVANPGFETNFAQNGFVVITTPAGWTIYNPQNINQFSDAVGVINPTGTQHYPGGAAEGRNAAVIFMDGPATGEAGLQQTLAATVQAERRYTLQVAVGNIASGTANFGYFNLAGFPGYRIELLAGTNIIASDNNSLAGSIPEGEFRTSTVAASINESNSAVGNALRIRLVNLNISGTPSEPGIEVNFDDVRMMEEPRRPTLAFQRGISNAVELSWVDVFGRFALQSSPGLSPPVWADVTNLPTALNGANHVALFATNSAQIWRLMATE